MRIFTSHGNEGQTTHERLIPSRSLSGRSLLILIAIMTFLTALAIGAALAVRSSVQDWASDITGELTIQIKPQPGRDIEKDIEQANAIARAANGVSEVRTLDLKASAALLEPWMGNSVDIAELPVPRLIRIKRLAGSKLNETALREALVKSVPSATLDNHQIWRGRLETFGAYFELTALAIILLVAAAMAISIFFAVRAAIYSTRHIVDVLHFVGASDEFISREFEKHFRLQGLIGGLAGAASTLAVLAAGKLLMSWTTAENALQSQMFFGSFSLGYKDWLVIVLLAALVSLLCGQVAKRAVREYLQSIR